MTKLLRTILCGASALLAMNALASQVRSEPLAAGATAPAFTLPDQNGKTHTLARDRGHVVLLAFYPADFTGGCTIEAHSLTAAYPSLKAEGVTVYGVSVQDPKSHKSFCSKEGIPYTLLADTDRKLTTAYGDLIPGAGIANRTTYIIGADGKVAFVDKNVNGHLNTCGADWAAWVKAHPAVKSVASASDYDIGTASAPNGIRATMGLLKRTAAATVGYAAPPFSLADAVTGEAKSLPALAQGKKATVVMFLSTRCPVSNAYNERMTALAKKYGAEGVSFVGIDANSTEARPEVAAFAKQHGFPFPVLKDTGNVVADRYDAHVTPETYVINSQGVLVYHGRIDNDMDTSNVKTHELADALDATLAGQPVAKAQTKAFGCSIKRG